MYLSMEVFAGNPFSEQNWWQPTALAAQGQEWSSEGSSSWTWPPNQSPSSPDLGTDQLYSDFLWTHGRLKGQASSSLFIITPSPFRGFLMLHTPWMGKAQFVPYLNGAGRFPPWKSKGRQSWAQGRVSRRTIPSWRVQGRRVSQMLTDFCGFKSTLPSSNKQEGPTSNTNDLTEF